jgi:predicted NAD-dependent protein-ADP-ribosyltransferase YbiA (DUF1768 family)
LSSPLFTVFKKDVIAAKFQNDGSQITQKLLATGNAILIEGNTWGDTFWGQCKGEGTNVLGNILMRRRDFLRSM